VTSKQWIIYLLLLVVAAAGTGLALNYRINAFGLFGDVRGKTYRSYITEREAKYLFSFNYIPANFDGILLGNSVTRNWDTRKIEGARTYNLSIDGAYITEEKILAENVFAHKGMHLVLFCVWPSMVINHGRKTAYMQPADYWSALGSSQLFREYVYRILGHSGSRKNDEFGVDDYSDLERNADPAKVEYRLSHPKAIILDETAFAEYRALLDEARINGARIVAFVPPHYAPVWNAPDYEAFLARMKSLFRPEEKVVDFNDRQYEQFRNSPDNFYDGVHVSGKAADFLASELSSRLIETKAR
jgi:hypothetical protein